MKQTIVLNGDSLTFSYHQENDHIGYVYSHKSKRFTDHKAIRLYLKMERIKTALALFCCVLVNVVMLCYL